MTEKEWKKILEGLTKKDTNLLDALDLKEFKRALVDISFDIFSNMIENKKTSTRDIIFGTLINNKEELIKFSSDELKKIVFVSQAATKFTAKVYEEQLQKHEIMVQQLIKKIEILQVKLKELTNSFKGQGNETVH